MGSDILVPLGLFGMISAIVIVPQILKSRERARLHDTLRAAYEKGQPVPPELVEALQANRLPPAPADRAERDLRIGLVWLAIGLGFLAIGGICYAGLYSVGGAREAFMTSAGFGAIPFFIGLAFLILSFFSRKSR